MTQVKIASNPRKPSRLGFALRPGPNRRLVLRETAAKVVRVKTNSILAALALSLAVADAADVKPGLKLVAEGFTQPTVYLPLDGGRALIGDQVGQAYLLNKDGSKRAQPALDLAGRLSKYNTNAFDERGLCGLAAHPQFASNGKIYVAYSAVLRSSAPTNYDHTARLSEFTLGKDDVAGQERVLLEIDMPYFNHHSGRLTFGPDGFLYVSVGDGGNSGDVGRGHSPQGNGQDTTKLQGKVLRIDVNKKDAGKEYAVPQDNPFVKGGGAPEIFAYGFRNPWGLSFDRGGAKELFLADVGQDSWEEVDIVVRGGNYGWNLREGPACFDPKAPRKPPEDCPKVGANGEPLIDPIVAYKNFGKYAKDPEARGISITGGYVYRGRALPQLSGKYVFGDWSKSWAKADGVIYAASKGTDGKWTFEAVNTGAPLGAYVLALGEDAEGELYILTNTSNALRGGNGKVWKLVAQ